VDEADALLAVDDKRGRPGDVKSRQPETMINAVAFDHRTVHIDKHRKW
jgi:hypothetical protein